MDEEVGKIIDLDVLLSIYFGVLIAPVNKLWDDLCFLTGDEIAYEQIVVAMHAVLPYVREVFPEIDLIEGMDAINMTVTIDNTIYNIDDVSIAFSPMPDEMKYIKEPIELIDFIRVSGVDVQMLKRVGKYYNS